MNRLLMLRRDQKPGSNMHKTDNFPKERETSFVKFVREAGKGYARRTREKEESRA
jgi:hypothetical protein